MDPYRVLDVAPGAPPGEVTASYRALAKRWHPDRHASDQEAARRMAEINAAYELLRAERWVEQKTPRPQAPPSMVVKSRRAGDWLPEPTRRALGPELLSALQSGEAVRLVTPASAWASPEALLAVTDHRLLWLLDDVVTNRVRTLAFGAITETSVKLSWPRRRTAVLRVSRRNGKRPITFGELRPETAHAIEGLVTEQAAA